MSYPAALKATVWKAGLFAVVYLLATASFDLWQRGAVEWGGQVVTVLLAAPVYWAAIAWFAQRKRRET